MREPTGKGPRCKLPRRLEAHVTRFRSPVPFVFHGKQIHDPSGRAALPLLAHDVASDSASYSPSYRSELSPWVLEGRHMHGIVGSFVGCRPARFLRPPLLEPAANLAGSSVRRCSGLLPSLAGSSARRCWKLLLTSPTPPPAATRANCRASPSPAPPPRVVVRSVLRQSCVSVPPKISSHN